MRYIGSKPKWTCYRHQQCNSGAYRMTTPTETSTSHNSFIFLHLARYVPNVAKRSVWEHWCNIEDRQLTDRPTWHFGKFRTHISATGHPIHFTFGSRVGFLGIADRMDLLPVGPNPRWWLAVILEISNGNISGTSRPIDFTGWGFQGWRIKWTYFRLDQIQDGGWPPYWKISNGHIWAMDHPICFIFDSRVGFSRSADQMALLPVVPNPRSRPSAVLHNFEWPYLWNGSSGTIRIWL